jgi:hypothetical protein
MSELFDDAHTVRGLLVQLAGYASKCWTPEGEQGTGFDSSRANNAVDAAMARLDALAEDSTSLAQRMRQAADTLRQANDRAGCDIEATQSWTPRRLERIAEVWEDAERDEQFRQDRLVDELVASIRTAGYNPREVATILVNQFDIRRREEKS